jgi:DNA polymerase-3 subunit delta'
MPFRDIIGHRKLVALLARSIGRGTLPPSLIFAGPPGVGKRLVAEAVAQAVNCLSPRQTGAPGDADDIDYDACGVCTACRRIARRVHPDVIVIEPGDTGSIKVDVVRDAVERANYRPFEGRRRAVIVDDADALVTGAQNALLKTLEEPPSASIFMLVTSRPDTLLATVRSRCPRLQFRPVAIEEVAAALVARGRTEEEAQAIAATADGSIGAALQASGDAVVDVRDLAMRILGQAAASDDPRRRIESAKDLIAKTGTGTADRELLGTRLRAMSALLRDVVLLATGAERTGLANADIEPALTRLSRFHGERGVQAFATLDRALAALDRNASVKIVADWVLVNL